MTVTQAPLEGFSPPLYLALLVEVAKSDGIQSVEVELLDGYAAQFGLDREHLPDIPDDLAGLPWCTRLLVFRDALTFAMADSDTPSAEEEAVLASLAARMALPGDIVEAVREWVYDHASLLQRLTELLEAPRA